MAAAVDVGLESAALFFDFAVLGQREDLETAAVGEQRALPSRKAVQPSRCLQYVHSRPQVKVVGVAEDDLGINVLVEFTPVYRLHCAGSAHGHENRSGYIAGVGAYHARACVTQCILFCYFKPHNYQLLSISEVSVMNKWLIFHFANIRIKSKIIIFLQKK